MARKTTTQIIYEGEATTFRLGNEAYQLLNWLKDHGFLIECCEVTEIDERMIIEFDEN